MRRAAVGKCFYAGLINRVTIISPDDFHSPTNSLRNRCQLFGTGGRYFDGESPTRDDADKPHVRLHGIPMLRAERRFLCTEYFSTDEVELLHLYLRRLIYHSGSDCNIIFTLVS